MGSLQDSDELTFDHILYETEDGDAPKCILDKDGEVVLSMCRVCWKGEVELSEPCDGSEHTKCPKCGGRDHPTHFDLTGQCFRCDLKDRQKRKGVS